MINLSTVEGGGHQANIRRMAVEFPQPEQQPYPLEKIISLTDWRRLMRAIDETHQSDYPLIAGYAKLASVAVSYPLDFKVRDPFFIKNSVESNLNQSASKNTLKTLKKVAGMVTIYGEEHPYVQSLDSELMDILYQGNLENIASMIENKAFDLTFPFALCQAFPSRVPSDRYVPDHLVSELVALNLPVDHRLSYTAELKVLRPQLIKSNELVRDAGIRGLVNAISAQIWLEVADILSQLAIISADDVRFIPVEEDPHFAKMNLVFGEETQSKLSQENPLPLRKELQ